MGDGDDHVLARDQVLVLDVGVAIDDLGAARRGELGTRPAPRATIVMTRSREPGCRDSPDGGASSVEFADDFVAAEAVRRCRRRARMARACHRKDGRCRPRRLVARVLDQLISGPTRRAGQSPAITGLRAPSRIGRAADERMTSSILATAMARPTRTWARSRVLRQWDLWRHLGRPERTKAPQACQSRLTTAPACRH